jgi:RNA polymerase sigma factor (sigma-70 family)
MGVDPAAHARLIGFVMAQCRVRERFRAADADDIAGELGLALVVAAANHRPELGRFSTYAVACLRPVALVGREGERHPLRMRARRVRWRRRRWWEEGDVDRVVRVSLFSELGRRFAHDSPLFATQPAAADVAAARLDPRLPAPVAAAMRDVLGAREAEVLERRHGLGRFHPHTLDEVGRALGITKERARQLQERAHKKLRDRLGETCPGGLDADA